MDDSVTGEVELLGQSLSGGSWDADKKTYTVSYAGLDYGTEYTVTISGFADIVGNVMDTNTRSFVTVYNTDATLSSLALSQGTLSPAFAKETTEYTVTVPYEVASLMVTPAASFPKAKVFVNGTELTVDSPSGTVGLDVGQNTVTVRVVAQDGVNEETYTITVTRAKDSTLSGLTLSDVDFARNFKAT